MNGNFIWAFLFSKEMMKKNVPPNNIDRSAAISALGVSGNPIVPFVWSQEKNNDEQEKQNLRNAITVERETKLDTDLLVNRIEAYITAEMEHENQLIPILIAEFTKPELEKIKVSAQSNKKTKVIELLNKMTP